MLKVQQVIKFRIENLKFKTKTVFRMMQDSCSKSGIFLKACKRALNNQGFCLYKND